MQILRREIGSVFPSKRVTFQPKPLKEVHVAQRIKYRTVEMAAQIHFAIRAVIEPEMNAVSRNTIGADDVQDHRSISGIIY